MTRFHINPTDLSNGIHRKLLGEFLRAEEAKKGQKLDEQKQPLEKRKSWKSNTDYTREDGTTISFPYHLIKRIPKKYHVIKILGPLDSMPDKETRERIFKETGKRTIYLKKSGKSVSACTTHEVNPKSLSAEQIKALEGLVTLDVESTQTIRNFKHAKIKKVFNVQVACGYQKYIYQIDGVGRVMGEGGAGTKVIRCCGKIEFINDEPIYIPNTLARDPAEQREPRKSKITKIIVDPYAFLAARRELYLLLNMPFLLQSLHTKGATIQKKNGVIEDFSITQEAVAGHELYYRLQATDFLGNTLPILTKEQRSGCVYKLVEAVFYMHAAGLIHRDIKLENTMLEIDKEGNLIIKLIDFGAALQIGEKDNKLMGTSDFWSPEVVFADPDPRHDVYSLGVLLRELCLDAVVVARYNARAELSERYGDDLAYLEDWKGFLQAEYYLNLSIPTAKLPLHFQKFAPVINGMTSPIRDRLSSRDAWGMLFPDRVKEMKEDVNSTTALVTRSDNVDTYNYEYGLKVIQTIRDQKLKEFLFSEACANLQEYIDALKDLKSNPAAKSACDFLKTCQKSIKNKKPKSVDLAIACISQIIFEEKKCLETHKINELRPTQLETLKQAFSSVAMKNQAPVPAQEQKEEKVAYVPLRKTTMLLPMTPTVVVDIDPTADLSPDHRKLLDDFLLAEEDKKGQKIDEKGERIEKHKTLLDKTIYPVGDKGIRFPDHIISRTPNRYNLLVILGRQYATMLDQTTRQTIRKETATRILYLKKYANGSVGFCTTSDQEKFLTPKQIKEIEKFVTLDVAEKTVIENIKHEDAEKKIFNIQVLCGYSKYSYRVLRVDDFIKAGMYGKVYISYGKLKFVGAHTQYIKYESPKVIKMIMRNPREPNALQDGRNELDKLRHNPYLFGIHHAKEGTIQKDSDGRYSIISITLDEAPGEQLTELLENLTTNQRLEIFWRVLNAVCEMHSRGCILHRDIKPDNFLVEIVDDVIETITLVDFGFVADLGKENDRVVGTPLYFPPEVFLKGFADSIIDDYGLGVLFRKLFTDSVMRENEKLWDQLYKVDVMNAGRDLAFYLRTHFRLNISMRKPRFSLDFKQAVENELGKEAFVVLQAIVNGMTMSLPDERWSSKKSLLSWAPFRPDRIEEVKEEKSPTSDSVKRMSALEKYDYDMGLETLKAINDQRIRNLLFDEVCEQLGCYCDTLGLPSDSLAFLKTCQIVIAICEGGREDLFDSEKGVTYSSLAIACISRIIFEEKKFLTENRRSEHDQNKFRQEQLILLKSALAVRLDIQKQVTDAMQSCAKSFPLVTEDLIEEPEEETLVVQGAAIVPMRTQSLMDYMRRAWNETFLPDVSLTKNPGSMLIKLPTEFLAKAVSEFFHFCVDGVKKGMKPTFSFADVPEYLLLGFVLYPLYITAEATRLLIRTVTSPIVSAKAGLKGDPTLAALSMLCSAAGFVAIAVIAAPLIAALGAKVGLTAGLNVIANMPILSQLTTPAVWLLNYVGIATTPAVIGGAFLSMATTSFLLLGKSVAGIIECCKKRKPADVVVLQPVEVVDSSDAKTPQSTARVSEGMGFTPVVLASQPDAQVVLGGGDVPQDQPVSPRITPPSPTSPDSAVDPHLSPSEQQHDRPTAASVSCKQ